MPCGPVFSYKLFRAAAISVMLSALGILNAPAQPVPVSTSSGLTAPSDNVAGTAARPSLASEILPLDFVIRTKSGKPVLNLQPSDLLVTDNGSAVELNTLRLVKGTDGKDRLVTFVFDSLDVAPAQDAGKLAGKILAQFPPTGYTFAVIRIAGGTPSQQATILPPGPSVRQISSSDAAGLPPRSGNTPVSGLHLLQNYTTSRDLLRKAIDQATAGNEAWQASGKATAAEEQLTAFARRDLRSVAPDERERAESLLTAINESRHSAEDGVRSPSLSALLALVRGQLQIAGRKIIVYFSQNLPADDDALNMVGSIIAEANRSEVSIVTVNPERAITMAVERTRGDDSTSYTVQMAAATMPVRTRESAWEAHYMAANELNTPPTAAGVPDMMQLGFSPGLVPGSSGAENAPGPQPPDPMAILSAATGGVSFTEAKLKKTLRQLRDDLTDYYEASYTPKLTRYDGEFHPLTVRARHGHFMVRSRAGYFALPPDSNSGMRLFEVPLLAILSSPRLPTEIDYHAQFLHLGEFSGQNTGELVVEIPLSQLHIRADADTNLSSEHLAILMQVRDARGEVVERFSEDLLRRGRASAAQLREIVDSGDDPASAVGRDAIVMERPFAAEPGEYTLESAVFDQFGDKAGAQRMTFTITAPQTQLLLSELTLVRRIDPLQGGGQQFDPMRYKDGSIIPDLSGVLPENTDHVTFFVVAHLAGETQPRLTLRILRDRRCVVEIPITIASPNAHAAAKPASENNVFPWLGTIQASTFPPGHYEVQATLNQGGQTATVSKSFVVEGKGSAPDVAFTAVSGEADPDRDLPAERRLTESAALGSSKFSITSPAHPLPPPTPAELQTLVESARQRALSWTESLPNFLCVETTWHSIYSRSGHSWQPSDTAVQRMRYVDHAEDRTLVELNGRRRELPPAVAFAHSTGEFGGALLGIFEPAAHAQFTWKGTDLLDGEPVQLLAYTVPRATSTFNATNEVNAAFVAFHGLVWIDTATHNIRRLTEILDDIPRNVGIRAASVAIDYAWVSIDGHEYMLPVHGAMSVLRGRHQAELNQFAFTDYHRFESQVRMLPWNPTQARLAH